MKAPIVRRIVSLYVDGKLGTTAIARTLDAEAAPPPRKQGCAKRAAAHPRQPRLQGPRPLGTHPGLHQPLVDDETFEKAQEILRLRGENASLRRGNPTNFLVSRWICSVLRRRR